MIQTEPSIVIRCDECGAEKAAKVVATGDPKLPPQWKRFGGQTFCKACKKSSLQNLVISMPVHDCLELTKDEMYTAFREACREARAISNVIMREAAKIDEGVGDDGKLVKWKPQASTYSECRAVAPEFPATSVSSLTQRLNSDYSARRFDMHVSGKASLPHFAKLQPVPIRADSWSALRTKRGPAISLRLGSTTAPIPRCDRVTLVLSDSREYARQLRDFDRIISGEATQADMRLCPRWRDGKLVGIMARMTLTRPRPSREGRTGIIRVEVGGDHLLSWAGMPPIELDEFRNLIVGSRARQQRKMNDLKHERRPSRHREGIVRKMNEESRRFQDAMKTRLGQAAAKLIGFVNRRSAAEIVWTELPERMDSFPWADLKLKVEQKCISEGITFTPAKADAEASGPAAPEAGQAQTPSSL